MSGFYQEAPLRRFSTSDLCATRARVLRDIAYYESGTRPIYPYYVGADEVPVILRGLRLQARELAAEMQRRGLVDDVKEDPPA